MGSICLMGTGFPLGVMKPWEVELHSQHWECTKCPRIVRVTMANFLLCDFYRNLKKSKEIIVPSSIGVVFCEGNEDGRQCGKRGGEGREPTGIRVPGDGT